MEPEPTSYLRIGLESYLRIGLSRVWSRFRLEEVKEEKILSWCYGSGDLEGIYKDITRMREYVVEWTGAEP